MGSGEIDLPLRLFAPRPMLRTAAHEIDRPRFPVIDAHNHLGDAFVTWSEGSLDQPVRQLLATMDEAGVRAMVDLDGRWGNHLRAEIARYQDPWPDRFAVFSGIDDDNVATDPNVGETEARRLRESVAMGARGLKVWKTLGLRLRDSQGVLIPVDDPRLDPLWATAGELKVPVLIHIADPVAFFQPLDRFNERWEELHENPDWHFYPTRPKGELSHPDFPSFEELMEQFERLLRRHPGTTFIGAHVGCYAENLRWVGRVMDACPNFYADISARIAELGRQPFTAREFFIHAPGPHPLRHGRGTEPTGLPDLLSLPGNPRRILQLRPASTARGWALAHLRPRPTRRCPAQGLRRECGASHIGWRVMGVGSQGVVGDRRAKTDRSSTLRFLLTTRHPSPVTCEKEYH